MSGACSLPAPWSGCPAPADKPANSSSSFCYIRDTAFGKRATAAAVAAAARGASSNSSGSGAGAGAGMDFDPRLNSVGRPRPSHALDEMVVEEDTRVVDPATEVRAGGPPGNDHSAPSRRPTLTHTPSPLAPPPGPLPPPPRA